MQQTHAVDPNVPTGWLRVIGVVTAITASEMELIDVTIVKVALNQQVGSP